MQGKHIESSHFSFEIRAEFNLNAIHKLLILILIYFGMHF